jgi:hypothetical protein
MHAISRRRFGAGLLAPGAALGAPAILRAQGTFELKLSHFVPSTHGMHTDFLDEASGDALIPKFGAWCNRWDRPGLEAAKARGNTITVLARQEREAWIAALRPMIGGWLDGLVADGVAEVREIYAEAQRLVALDSEA